MDESVDTPTYPGKFPESRYLHCHSTGKKMYEYAKNVLNWDEDKCNEMFILGCIHDIGYELDSTLEGHGSAIAKAMPGYKYAKELEQHTWLHEDASEELKLLQFADATVDGYGNWCTFEERREDTNKRYGSNSPNAITGNKIVAFLEQQGFDDKFSIGDSHECK